MNTKKTATIKSQSPLNKTRKALYYACVVSGLCALSNAAYSFEPLDEDAMRNVDGQALFTLGYLAPTDNTNLAVDTDGTTKNIGFYRFGMEAELELNANIKKLQLGCGGVNGAGACDIDIDNLSLSGLKIDPATGKSLPMTNEERAASSAKLTNPFIEFAIKNPQSAALREMVGVRFSAEKLKGFLTAGLENGNTASGINVLSGYMKIASDSTADVIKGKMDTMPSYIDASWFWNNRTIDTQTGSTRNACGGAPCKYSDGTNIEPLKGSFSAPLAAKANFQVNGGGFWIPGVTDTAFSAPLSSLRGMRVDGTVIPPFLIELMGRKSKALVIV